MTVSEALSSEKFSVHNDTIDGIPVTVGYLKEFRWSWFAVQMNLFFIIAETTGRIDKPLLEKFSEACFKYALKNNKGWWRGFQAAVGSIAMLKGTDVEPSAIDYAENTLKKHWSAFEIATTFNDTNKQVTRFKKNPIWGRIFFPFFAKKIDSVAAKL